MTDSKMVDFFSLIPEDIHHAIVSRLISAVGYRYDDGKVYTTNKKHLESLLEYAKLTPLSHRIVIEAMRFRFAPWYCSSVSVKWIAYFADDLQEIDFSCAAFRKGPQPLPKLSKLRKASIRSTSHQFKLIRNAPSLEHLSIEFCGNCDWMVLVSILKRLPLKNFVMRFYPSFMSPLHVLSAKLLAELNDSCTNVHHITLRGHITLTKSVYDMISGFKSLNKLSLEATIHSNDLPHLKAYTNLGFINLPPNSLNVIANLGRRVKEISCREQSRNQIESLTSLPNLKVLDIEPSCTVQETIRALGTVIGHLEALKIRFPYSLSKINGIHFPKYKTLDGNEFAVLLEEAKRLKSLCIDQSSLDSEAVKTILQVVGDKLKEFHICIDWQNEPAAQRIENILRSAAKHCPNLKVLRLLEKRSGSGPFASGPTIISTKEQRDSCMRSLSNLKSNSPHFSSLDELRSLILARFHRAPRKRRGNQWDAVLLHNV